MTSTTIGANILLISSISYLFLLWWTNSLRVSIATTQMIITVIIVGVLHKAGMLFVGFVVLIVSLGSLVWRVIPSSKQDTWNKDDYEKRLHELNEAMPHDYEDGTYTAEEIIGKDE